MLDVCIVLSLCLSIIAMILQTLTCNNLKKQIRKLTTENENLKRQLAEKSVTPTEEKDSGIYVTQDLMFGDEEPTYTVTGLGDEPDVSDLKFGD